MASSQLAQIAPAEISKSTGVKNAKGQAKTGTAKKTDFSRLLIELLAKSGGTATRGTATWGAVNRDSPNGGTVGKGTAGKTPLEGKLRSKGKHLRQVKHGLDSRLEGLDGKISPAKTGQAVDKPANSADSLDRLKSEQGGQISKKKLVSGLAGKEQLQKNLNSAGWQEPSEDMAVEGKTLPSSADLTLSNLHPVDGAVDSKASVVAQAGIENESPVKVADIDAKAEIGADRQSDNNQVRVVVVDLRSKKAGAGSPGSKVNRKPQAESRDSGHIEANISEKEEIDVKYFVKSSARTHGDGVDSSATSHGKSGDAAMPDIRQSMADKFKEAFKNEIVRQSGIVVKDGGKGELRLILKPESLGRVLIKLQLDNNHIEGRIIVENSTVKEMFESSLRGLSGAFEKEGFSSASLEVSVGSGNANGQQKNAEKPFTGVVGEIERPDMFDDGYRISDQLINLTA